VAGLIGGCGRPTDPKTDESEAGSNAASAGSPGNKRPASPPGPSSADGAPFEGPLEHLRPGARAGWPLENIDIQRYPGWRIDPVHGGYEQVVGLVFRAEPGAFTLAIADGRVSAVERADSGAPAFVVIDHGQGIITRTGPLSEEAVHEGLPIARGVVLGLAAGPSLTLEVRVDGVAIDPLLVIRRPLHRWPALTRELPPPPNEPRAEPESAGG